MPIVSEVPPLLKHLLELQDMHTLLSCAALSQGEILEIELSELSTSVQTALRTYLAAIEKETSYISDYIEFPECSMIHIVDLAAIRLENFAQA